MEQIRMGNPFNYDRDVVSKETGLACADESLAVQSAKEDADINTIVRRFGVTGVLPEVPRPPVYGDFSESVSDYRTAMDLINAADRSFMALPAEVRARFANDPARFVDFVSNPDNLEECRRMGLAEPKKEVSDGGVQGSAEAGNSGAEAGDGSASR